MIGNATLPVCGALAGLLHFSLLRWNATLYARRGPAWKAAGLQIARISVLGMVLVAAAQHGALALLLMATGMMVVRPFAMLVLP